MAKARWDHCCLGSSTTFGLVLKSHVLRGDLPLLVPVTATCLSMWRFSLPPSFISPFWLNQASSSFKLVCHGSWLLLVGRSPRDDEVCMV